VAAKSARLHGRIEGANARCAVHGCTEPGEFRAPVHPSDFDGPGTWHLLCLDHVREHNAKYNYFDGMSPEEITEAQSPLAGWERATRAFATAGGDPAPAWTDFADPIDAISGRFGTRRRQAAPSRFSGTERHALEVLGLGQESDLHSVRQRYSDLVRRYHPDRNGGDRRHEAKLGQVIEAWQVLRKAAAFE
jgi:DnaJ domain